MYLFFDCVSSCTTSFITGKNEGSHWTMLRKTQNISEQEKSIPYIMLRCHTLASRENFPRKPPALGFYYKLAY